MVDVASVTAKVMKLVASLDPAARKALLDYLAVVAPSLPAPSVRDGDPGDEN